MSPPRRRSRPADADLSPPRRGEVKQEPDSDGGDISPPRKPGLMAKTLDGKRAGLQKAKDLKDELNSIRRKEKEVFSKVRNGIHKVINRVSRKGICSS